MFNRPSMKADLLLKQQAPLCRFWSVSSLVPCVTLFRELNGIGLLERYIVYLDYDFLVLIHLVEKVSGACHPFDPGESMSRQAPVSFCVVILSPAGTLKDGCGFTLLGHTLEYSLFHAFTGEYYIVMKTSKTADTSIGIPALSAWAFQCLVLKSSG